MTKFGASQWIGNRDFIIAGYFTNTLERLALITHEDNESRYNFVIELLNSWSKLERH